MLIIPIRAARARIIAASPAFRAVVFCSSLILAALFSGCGDSAEQHAHENSHAADHQDIQAELLRWSENLDWFIRYEPLVAGESSQWTFHLTERRNGKPPENAGVLLRVEFADGSTREIKARQLQTGIHVLTMTPPAPGYAQLLLTSRSDEFTDTLRLKRLPVFATFEAMRAATPDEAEEGIVFTREEAWNMEFRVEEVRKQRIPSIIKTTGHLLSHPSMELSVSATASGIVRYRLQPLVPGQRVAKDALLAVIEGGEMSEDNLVARIADAEAELGNATQEYDRVRALVADDVLPIKRLQEVELRLQQARTAVRTLTANVKDGAKRIVSPIAGYIRDVGVPNGGFVQSGQRLLTVARNDRMLLKAELYQNNYAQLPNINGATFRTDDGRSFDIRELNGTLRARGAAVDASAYSIPVYFEIDGASLLPGEFVDVYLHAGEEKARLVLPISALTEELGTFAVYVQTGGERFEKRQVRVGTGDGTYVPVLEGVQEGERVVTQGVHAVRLAASAGQIQAHNHEH